MIVEQKLIDLLYHLNHKNDQMTTEIREIFKPSTTLQN